MNVFGRGAGSILWGKIRNTGFLVIRDAAAAHGMSRACRSTSRTPIDGRRKRGENRWCLLIFNETTPWLIKIIINQQHNKINPIFSFYENFPHDLYNPCCAKVCGRTKKQMCLVTSIFVHHYGKPIRGYTALNRIFFVAPSPQRGGCEKTRVCRSTPGFTVILFSAWPRSRWPACTVR